MPYRINPDNALCVQVETASGWRDEHCHDTAAQAREHLQALVINVEETTMNINKVANTAVKSLGNEGRIGGYLVVWGDAQNRDLQGEYFTPDTNFELDWYSERPALYHHGLDGTIKTSAIGRIDTIKRDDIGLWAEAQLNMRKEYVEAVMKLVNEGHLAWSSGSLAHLVDIEDGEIKRWALVEGSLTPTPAEPRNTNISAIKSAYTELGLDLSKLNLPATDAKGHIDDNGRDAVKEYQTVTKQDSTKETLMNEELRAELREMVMGMIAEYMADMKAETKMTDEDEVEMLEELVESVESKMDYDDTMKSISVNDVSTAVVAALPTAIEKVLSAREARKSALKAAFNDGMKAAIKNAPSAPVSGGGRTASPRVTVGQNLRYAHLSASDMALGAMMLMAPAKAAGLNVKLNQVLSDEYITHMAHKAAKYAASEPFSKRTDEGRQGNAAIKMALPVKADELDATNIATQGAEWVGEFYSTDMWLRERYRTHYDMLVEKGMMVEVIPQGFDTAYFPTEGADPIAYVAPQANSTDATGRPETTININPLLTGRVSVTPSEVKIATAFTVTLEEDSIIRFAANANRQLQAKALETRDQILVNGDTTSGTTNINYDGATVPSGLSTPYYRATNGFRKLPIVTNTANGRDASNSLNVTDYLNTFALLDGELRQYRDRMCFMVDPDTEVATLNLLEIKTDDVRRPAGTITNGMVTNMYGIDVVSNGWIPLTDADGKVTAAGNAVNRGTILLVYAPYWGFAYKRNITLETGRDFYSGSNVYVMSMRVGMMARGNNAAALSYNVSNTIS